jgi:phosphatidate cytidylyltransferase
MLKQRIITALLMLAVLLPALLVATPWPFVVVMLLLISAAGWEWGRLNGLAMAPSLGLGGLLALAAAAAGAVGWVGHAPSLLWSLATAVWVLGGAYAIRGGVAAWPKHPQAARLALGVLILWMAWLAVSVAKTLGLNFILSLFCLVWAADISAYFGGRRFGRRKLALAISPGKSWEGVYAGIVGVFVLAFAWVAFDHWLLARGTGATPSLYTLLLARYGGLGTALALVFLAAMSVLGDLFESLVKRAAGAKDSSRLLPGHGGVLDRIDALLPVCPIALGLIGA